MNYIKGTIIPVAMSENEAMFRTIILELRTALEFYANPPNDGSVLVPDFYDEYCFYETARKALNKMYSINNT